MSVSVFCLFQLISKILTIPNVIGCGEVFDVFEVALDKKIKDTEQNAETVQTVTDSMKKNEITEFYFRYMSRRIRFYTQCGYQVGSKFTGTLGAFVKTEKHMQALDRLPECLKSKATIPIPNLVALISNHVAVFQPQNKLFYNGEHIADILDPSVVQGADIAAAQVREQYLDRCQQVFKTQDDQEVKCQLLENTKDLEKSKGEMVHIWGAKSMPGLGQIVSCNYGLGLGNGNGAQGFHIIIKDRCNEFRFSQPGDSGSVICKPSKDGKHLYAVGMLIGELLSRITESDSSDENDSSSDDECGKFMEKGTNRKTKRYSAFEIQYGIDRLKEAYHQNFEWLL